MNRIKEILDKSETLLEHMLERRKLQAGRIFTEKYRVWKYKFKNETDFFMQNKEDDKNNLDRLERGALFPHFFIDQIFLLF